jgi:hypothetical protein
LKQNDNAPPAWIQRGDADEMSKGIMAANLGERFGVRDTHRTKDANEREQKNNPSKKNENRGIFRFHGSVRISIVRSLMNQKLEPTVNTDVKEEMISYQHSSRICSNHQETSNQAECAE